MFCVYVIRRHRLTDARLLCERSGRRHECEHQRCGHPAETLHMNIPFPLDGWSARELVRYAGFVKSDGPQSVPWLPDPRERTQQLGSALRTLRSSTKPHSPASHFQSATPASTPKSAFGSSTVGHRQIAGLRLGRYASRASMLLAPPCAARSRRTAQRSRAMPSRRGPAAQPAGPRGRASPPGRCHARAGPTRGGGRNRRLAVQCAAPVPAAPTARRSRTGRPPAAAPP